MPIASLLMIAACIEAFTGVALIAVPNVITPLLLGETRPARDWPLPASPASLCSRWRSLSGAVGRNTARARRWLPCSPITFWLLYISPILESMAAS